LQIGTTPEIIPAPAPFHQEESLREIADAQEQSVG